MPPLLLIPMVLWCYSMVQYMYCALVQASDAPCVHRFPLVHGEHYVHGMCSRPSPAMHADPGIQKLLHGLQDNAVWEGGTADHHHKDNSNYSSFLPTVPSFTLQVPLVPLGLPSVTLKVPPISLQLPSVTLQLPSLTLQLPSVPLQLPSGGVPCAVRALCEK